MHADYGGQRQVASTIGRFVAGALAIGFVWIWSREASGSAATGQLSAIWAAVPDFVREEGPVRLWTCRVLLGILAGVLARVILPRPVAPELFSCMLSGMVVLAFTHSLAAQLGDPEPSNLSLDQLAVATGGTILFIIGGKLLSR